MMNTKDYILENMIKDFDEAEIKGFYIIPTDEEYDEDSGYNCIQIIGYGSDENNAKKYYDFGSCHDVVNLMNFGINGISIDVERKNGLIRIFWSDRKNVKVSRGDTFRVYGEKIK